MFRGLWMHPTSSRAQERPTPRRTPSSPAVGERPAPTLHDDGAHAAEYTTHEHKEWFTEWWYFNVRDPKTGISLLGVYSASPFGLGGGAFGTMVFREGAEPFECLDPYPQSQVKTSPERADVTVGPNSVQAIDDDHYRILSKSRDGRVAWDLTLERVPGADPAWLLANAQGPLDWEEGWWMSWLPLAKARGTLTIDGETHQLDGVPAYHDHNWGVWLSPARNWQWLQCSLLDERVALDLGYSDGFDPARVALFQIEGKTYHFDVAGIDLPTYAGFQYWPDTPWKFPESAKTTIIDRDDKVKVEVAWSAPAKATLPMPTAIVLFEQRVDVTLRVSERASDGSWGAPRTIAMEGIAEWSDSYVADWQTGEGLVGGYAAEATVFGGGVSGLTAAHELVQRGFQVTVIEAEVALDTKGVRGMALGGMARSHYARVPRLGPAPTNRPAGRPTPDSRDDHWENRRLTFTADSDDVSRDAERAIAEAAREFQNTFAEQGYRLRVAGGASAVEHEPRALGRRRAERVADRLVEHGVARDCIALVEHQANAPEAHVALEDYVLPGEHGFRFFPAYYRHLTDTLARIPVYDQDGRMTDRRVLDNLRSTTENLTLHSGRKPTMMPSGSSSPTQMLKYAISSLVDNDYDVRDFLQMGIRISRYLATCPERREPLEDISWWNYLCGFSPKTRCYLYRYSNSFSRDATSSGRVLAAFDWRYGDARTNGSTWMQLFEPLPDATPGRTDAYLNGPTTDAWLVHWRRFLGERGVRFVSGTLDRLEVEKVDGKDVVVPWVQRTGKTSPEPWRPQTRDPQYLVVATDPSGAERLSARLPKVGVPAGLVHYTTRFEDQTRDPYKDPGIKPNDRLQTLSGVQFFFDQDFAIGDGAYSLDAKWSLSTVSMNRIWSRVRFKQKDGFAGFLTVDIGDFKVPAGPEQKSAWDSTYERIGEQIWTQLSNDLRTDPLGGGPLRLPRPTWFHIDDNLEFGDRDEMKGVVVRNGTPYLVPITGDWRRRPGPSPFDPSVPDARVPPTPAEPGVWTAPHGGYPVHWDSLVYAGIYLKTFTRMTTMESANESARHAVNAILDHYNAHHGATVPTPPPPPDRHPDPSSLSADEVPPLYVGDYCKIWNIERYEVASFDSLKAVDQVLFDLGLPHLFDLLGIELIPSVLSHLFPYAGDCSPWGEAPPKPIPPPAPWCPPFIGAKLGSAVGKIAAAFKKKPR